MLVEITVFGMPLVRQSRSQRGQRGGGPVTILGLSPVQPGGGGLPSLAHLYSGAVRVGRRGAGVYQVPRVRGDLSRLYRVATVPRPRVVREEQARRRSAGRRGRGVGAGRVVEREPAYARTRMAGLRRAMLEMKRFAIADLVRVGQSLGLSESAVRSYVSKLEARGLVRRLGRGVYELTEEGVAYIVSIHRGAPSTEDVLAAAGRDIVRAGAAVKRWLSERLKRRKAVKVPVEEAGEEGVAEEAGGGEEEGAEGGE